MDSKGGENEWKEWFRGGRFESSYSSRRRDVNSGALKKGGKCEGKTCQ